MRRRSASKGCQRGHPIANHSLLSSTRGSNSNNLTLRLSDGLILLVVNTIFSANLAASGSPTNFALLPSQNDSNPADSQRPYIPTIGDRLDAAGVTWKWYSGGWDKAVLSSPSNPAHYGTNLTVVSPLFQ